MSRVHDEQAIGLAGTLQAAALVEQIATRGMVSQNSLETSIYSIMQLSPKTTEDIFGGAEMLPYNLHLGIDCLKNLVDKSRKEHNRTTIQYMLGMIHLERKLSANPDMMQTITYRIRQIKEQARYFNSEDSNTMQTPSSFCHPSIITNIATLYLDTISTFKFRIHVMGEQKLLQNTENAAKVRALLLAGIRSAMLWRQKGGSRWHLAFCKAKLRESLKKITA